MFSIEPLPYSYDALEPAISQRALTIHYEKHHKGYLDKLNAAPEGAISKDATLEDVVRTAEGDVYNNAAQVWNHSFFWEGMKPGGGGRPSGMLLTVIEGAFGSFADFRQSFAEAANDEFGSGWAWLVHDRHGRLQVQRSSDAENPMQRDYTPLLTLDVWEHAYYLDYQNRRNEYVENFIDRLINWDHVSLQLRLPSKEEIASWDEEDRKKEAERWGPLGEDTDGDAKPSS